MSLHFKPPHPSPFPAGEAQPPQVARLGLPPFLWAAERAEVSGRREIKRA